MLDFGARVGHYALPAARAVGRHGLVYAIDKDEQALHQLETKAALVRLTNIRCVHTSGDTRLDVGTGEVDACLCYDVLHLLAKPDRAQLYSEIRRLLKGGGCLSVYPKHVAGDQPSAHFGSLTTDDIVAEIEDAGIAFDRKICGTLSHDDRPMQGCVFNFCSVKDPQ